MTKFWRLKDSLEKLMSQAASLALKDAQLERVDAIYIGVMNAEEFVGDSNFAAILADTLGLTGIPSTRVETASSTGAGAFETAFYAVASGHMKNVLVLAGEKMTHLPPAKTTRTLSEVIDRSERRYGATMPALAAMIAKNMHKNTISQSRGWGTSRGRFWPRSTGGDRLSTQRGGRRREVVGEGRDWIGPKHWRPGE